MRFNNNELRASSGIIVGVSQTPDDVKRVQNAAAGINQPIQPLSVFLPRVIEQKMYQFTPEDFWGVDNRAFGIIRGHQIIKEYLSWPHPEDGIVTNNESSTANPLQGTYEDIEIVPAVQWHSSFKLDLGMEKEYNTLINHYRNLDPSVSLTDYVERKLKNLKRGWERAKEYVGFFGTTRVYKCEGLATSSDVAVDNTVLSGGALSTLTTIIDIDNAITGMLSAYYAQNGSTTAPTHLVMSQEEHLALSRILADTTTGKVSLLEHITDRFQKENPSFVIRRNAWLNKDTFNAETGNNVNRYLLYSNPDGQDVYQLVPHDGEILEPVVVGSRFSQEAGVLGCMTGAIFTRPQEALYFDAP